MGNLLPVVLGGLFGGLLRGLMGVAKTLITKKEATIDYGYFFLSLVVSMTVGVIAASLWPEGDLRVALLAGYAGSDFLESLYKLKFQQRFYPVNQPPST
jgi:fluoride ion exporter CrcB/FEX